jgi:uncharacterized protein related to proFAR isomerase
MMLIPVIDLRRGQVVRARHGRRDEYRPVVSMLAGGSDPVVLARALCRHCASSRLYVADLDALLAQSPQTATLRALLDALPGIELWLDAGFADAAEAEALCQDLGAGASRVVPVFGSESLASRAALQQCATLERAVLSLDRRDGQPLDRAGCWQAPALWPRDVIVMTLERVGSAAGPDLSTLAELQRRAPAARLVGAGGIRDAGDLARARAAGAHGWLVASALHDGHLGALQAAGSLPGGVP